MVTLGGGGSGGELLAGVPPPQPLRTKPAVPKIPHRASLPAAFFHLITLLASPPQFVPPVSAEPEAVEVNAGLV